MFKKLRVLNNRADAGSFETRQQAMQELKAYERRAREISDQGLEETELKEILTDFKTHSEAMKSAGTKEKHAYLVNEMELLLAGTYNKEEFVIRLIEAYDYSIEEEKAMQSDLLKEIQRSEKLILSVFDHINEQCKEKKGIQSNG